MMPVFVITPSDVITAVLFGIVLVAILLIILATTVQQWLCKHADVHETPACDAVCRKCGKNLGFIGTWREKQKAKPC